MIDIKGTLKIHVFCLLCLTLVNCAAPRKDLPRYDQMPPGPRIGIVNLLEKEAKLVFLKDFGKLSTKNIIVDWELPNYIDVKLTEAIQSRIKGEVVILPASTEIFQHKDKLYGFWPLSTELGVNEQAISGISQLLDANNLDAVIFVLSYHKLHQMGAKNIVNKMQGKLPTGFSGYGLFITEGALSSYPGMGMVKVPRTAAPFASIAIESYCSKPLAYMGGTGPNSVAGATIANVPGFPFPTNIENMSTEDFNHIENDVKMLVNQLVEAAFTNAGLTP